MEKNPPDPKDQESIIQAEIDSLFKSVDESYAAISQAAKNCIEATSKANIETAARYNILFHDAIVEYNLLLKKAVARASEEVKRNAQFWKAVQSRNGNFRSIQSNFENVMKSTQVNFANIQQNPMMQAMYEAGLERMKDIEKIWASAMGSKKSQKI